jgi:hypothetical protein
MAGHVVDAITPGGEEKQRRFDVVEFYWVCRCLDQDPTKVYGELTTAFRREDRRGRKQG